MEREPRARLIFVGDVHGAFGDDDARWMNSAGADGVVFVGDLGGGLRGGPPACAPAMAGLLTPAYWIPGNHDGVSFAELGAEIVAKPLVGGWPSGAIAERLRAWDAALSPLRRRAYCVEPIGGVGVVFGRSHSLGGPAFGFGAYLTAAHGVGDLEASAARLCDLVDAAPPGPVVLVAHNGPSGCGARRVDPFGRDFHPAEGDWGDADLRAAVDHARRAGRPVLCFAGHMHLRTRGGAPRRRVHEEPGALIVNTAEVPRVDRAGWRHHTALTLWDDRAEVSAVAVCGDAVQTTPLGVLRFTPA